MNVIFSPVATVIAMELIHLAVDFFSAERKSGVEGHPTVSTYNTIVACFSPWVK